MTLSDLFVVVANEPVIVVVRVVERGSERKGGVVRSRLRWEVGRRVGVGRVRVGRGGWVGDELGEVDPALGGAVVVVRGGRGVRGRGEVVLVGGVRGRDLVVRHLLLVEGGHLHLDGGGRRSAHFVGLLRVRVEALLVSCVAVDGLVGVIVISRGGTVGRVRAAKLRKRERMWKKESGKRVKSYNC